MEKILLRITRMALTSGKIFLNIEKKYKTSESGMLLYQSRKLHKISKVYKKAMKRKNRKCLGKMIVALWSVQVVTQGWQQLSGVGCQPSYFNISCTRLPSTLTEIYNIFPAFQLLTKVAVFLTLRSFKFKSVWSRRIWE